MKNKAKPISRQKKLTKTVSKKMQSPKNINKRKPLNTLYWQSSLDAVTDAVCFLDADHRILHCNRAMSEMFGLSQKELSGHYCWEIIHANKKQVSKCPAERSKNSLVREKTEIRMGEKWFRIIADPILDKKGIIKGMVHTLQDITEHKHTTQSMQETEKKYRDLLENASEVIFSVDPQGRITYISPAMEHLTGYSTDEVIGTNMSDHIMPEDLPDVLSRFERMLTSCKRETFEYRVKIKSGGIRYVVSSSNVIMKDGQPVSIIGVITDITERKQAEEALQAAELKFRNIFESASDGILLADFNNKNFISANDSICFMLGYTKEELLRLNVSDIHPKDSLTYVIDQFERLAKKEITIVHDIPMMRKDKTVFFADVNSSSIILEGKECLMGIFRDITERKQLEKVLKERDIVFRKLSTNVPGIIYQFMMKPDGTYCVPFSTEAVKEIYGCSPEDIVNDFSPIAKVVHPEDVERFIDSIKLSAKNMSQWRCEYRIQVPGKPLRWLFGTSTPEKLPDGSIIWHGFNTDITERKKGQEILQQKNEMLARTEQIANIGSWEWDIESDRVRWSDELFRIFQRNPSLGAPSFAEYSAIYIAKDMELLRQAVERCVTDGTPYELELRGIRTDGEIRHCVARGNAHTNTAGQIYQLFGSLQDITERKRIEEALRKNELMFRSLFENSPVGVFLVMDRTFVQVNPALCNITGYSPEELIGQSVRIGYADDEEYERAGSILYEQVMKKGIGSVEALCRRKNGDTFYGLLFLSQIDPQDSSLGYEGIMVDIDERKRADEKLKFEQQRFRSLTESSSDIIIVLNTQGIVTYTNPAIEKVLGYAPEERIGRNGLEFVHPDDLQSMVDKFNILISSTKYSVLHAETRLRHKDGSWRIFETTGNNLVKDNVVEAVIVRQHDITDRKKAEEELFESKERYRIMFEDSPDPYLIMGDGVILSCNRAAEKMFRGPREKIIGLSPDQFSPKFQPNGRLSKEAVKEHVENIAQKGHYTFEWMHTRLDGSDFSAEVSASTMVMDGRIVLLGVFRDITARKNMEEALKRSEEDFRSLFEQSIDGIIINDQSSIIEANHAFCVMSGYPIEKIVGKNPFDFIHPDDRAVAAQRLEQRLKGTPSFEGYIYRAIRADGSISLIDLRSKLIEWKGKPAFLTIISDITEQRQAQDALRASEEKYRGIFDESIITIYVFDIKKNFIDSNQAGLDLLGYTREELMKMSIPDVDADPVSVLPAHQELFDGGRLINYEHRLRRKDGSIITVLNNSRPLTDNKGKPIGMLSTLLDITERRHAEEALRESETKLRAVIQGSPVPQFVIDQNHKILYWNKALEDISGIKSASVLGTNRQWQAFYPKERPCLADLLVDEKIYLISEFYKGKYNESRFLEGVYEAKDFFPAMGKKGKWLFFSAAPIRDARGNIIGAVETLEDITERENAEAALQSEFARLQTMVSNAPVVIFAVDKEGVFTLSEGKALTSMGLKGGEVVGRSAFDVYRDSPEDQEHFRRALNGETFIAPVQVGDHSFEAYHTPILGKDGKFDGSSGILVDVTERKNAEEELGKYRQHLEDLVRERTIHLEASNKELEAFSYSASHDLRAPLRSIEGFSQALLEDYEQKFDAQGKDYLSRIKLATRRMADLIEDMLQLSRITRMEMIIEKVDLTTIARSLIIELQKSHPERNVRVKITEGLEDKADLRLTRIILDNLLRNAWKFTEKQPKATIEVGLWKMEDGKKTYFIRDNGAGFDMAYADKLFAPFQRLHADDEFPGTGIGLATVRRILNRHGGKIWAEGETGKGATFYFSFSEK